MTYSDPDRKDRSTKGPAPHLTHNSHGIVLQTHGRLEVFKAYQGIEISVGIFETGFVLSRSIPRAVCAR
eukprot:137280-Amphidinium_carterae.1